MIRYVPVDYGRDFAFFNTVNERYVEFNGNQAWRRIEDFVNDVRATEKLTLMDHDLQRFLALIPPTAP